MTTIKQHLIDTDKAVLLSVCCVCLHMYDIKAGHGVCGVSHGYCPTCLDIQIKLARNGVKIN